MPFLSLAHALSEFCEVTVTIDKIIEGVSLNNNSVVEHGKFGAVLHCCQAVSHNNGSAVGHDTLERVIDKPLRRFVEGASCLVKEKNARLANNSSCNRDTLFLAARELATSVTGKDVIASVDVLALLRSSPIID